MSRRIGVSLAWTLLFDSIASAAGGTLQRLLAHQVTAGLLAIRLAFIACSVIGAFIATRVPENRIGWLVTLGGLGTAVACGRGSYAVYSSLGSHARLPLTGVAASVSRSLACATFALLLFLLLLFPDGRAVTRRWRWVSWLTGLTIFGLGLVGTFEPGEFDDDLHIQNPFGIPGTLPSFEIVGGLFFLVVFFVATLAVSVMVVRYRRACGEQRQQIKWFALGGAAMILRVVASIVINDRTLHQTVYALGMILLPLGAGIGILKYRLYDIDLIINRASVYGSLGVLLALVYVFGVFGSQTAVGLVTHRSQGASPLVFVVTALVLAALFQPVRQRIQTAIDRRFYRLKYDTARTSASFATTPRNEVDVQELSGSLLGVVEVTMQPAQVTLWISPQVEVKA